MNLRMMILSGREKLMWRICSNLMHLDFNLNETFNKTCTNEKKADVFRPNYFI